MTREELIEKARRFEYPLNDTNWGQCVAEAMADFALSLQEPESKPWPQLNDTYYYRDGSGGIYAEEYRGTFVDAARRAIGNTRRTIAECHRANKVEAANAAIKRWRDENCPFVADWTECNQPKWRSKYDHLKKRYCATTSWAEESFNTIYFRTSDDLARCQSELPDAWAALVGVK